MNQALVQGKPVELHRVVMAQQEAQIAFDLVIQMRDKIVMAYQELMRMPM
jgi:flagellar hook-basal body complex protein FliE